MGELRAELAEHKGEPETLTVEQGDKAIGQRKKVLSELKTTAAVERGLRLQVRREPQKEEGTAKVLPTLPTKAHVPMA